MLPLSVLAFAAGLLLEGAMASAQTGIETPLRAGALAGTLLAPLDSHQHPVVLIIPGSGRTDRAGNNPLGIQAAPYRLLAEGLAGRGIASVRIDKRGLFGSAGAEANPNDVTLTVYAADVRLWVSEIGKQRGAS